MNLGDRIRAARMTAQMSPKEAAEAIGVDPSAISDWQRNVRAPNAAGLKALCEVFDVSADVILGLTQKFPTVRPLNLDPRKCRTVVRPDSPANAPERQCQNTGRYNGLCGVHR